MGLFGALPFLVLQGAFNLRVTGRVTETPFDFYTRQVYPLATYGFHGSDPSVRPSWPLPQVHAAYDDLLQGSLRDHTPTKALVHWATDYLPDTIYNILPHSLLIVLIPLGFLGLRGRRWLLFAMLPLFVALYFPYVFFIRHYSTIVIPSGILLIVLGVRVLSDFSPSFRAQILTFLVACIVPLVISDWPTFNRLARDEFLPADSLRTIEQRIENVPHRPAIVLFHFSLGDPIDLEPVYNAETIWPDDAPIIRAHDRGEMNSELFRYYAQRQPDRWVYLYNRSDGTLTDLGLVQKLAGSP